VHQLSIFDSWRDPQRPSEPVPGTKAAEELVQIK
jgi:hypothetical protein